MRFVKSNLYVLVGIACLALMGVLYVWQHSRPHLLISPNASPVTLYATEPLPEAEAPAPLPPTKKVHISGEVAAPGVYVLDEGDRIEDALKAAGGATDDADLTRINLAARIVDEMRIVVPDIHDTTQAEYVTGVSAYAEAAVWPVNINTATQAQLETLPGIGPARAAGIIRHRTENGLFLATEDIKNVSGIGDKIFDNIKDSITVH